ncbi:hypothetical protein Glove_236g49 [Diversispora epigaea]|uniref:Uncharacterized protein n=1 Tax=Diversispora epigaea TaxID=1348612 RepID=A0A397IAK1_9GLOM|nr:hypothetical protein Glove_236g49 [Diversispora epigaea]
MTDIEEGKIINLNTNSNINRDKKIFSQEEKNERILKLNLVQDASTENNSLTRVIRKYSLLCFLPFVGALIWIVFLFTDSDGDTISETAEIIKNSITGVSSIISILLGIKGIFIDIKSPSHEDQDKIGLLPDIHDSATCSINKRGSGEHLDEINDEIVKRTKKLRRAGTIHFTIILIFSIILLVLVFSDISMILKAIKCDAFIDCESTISHYCNLNNQPLYKKPFNKYRDEICVNLKGANCAKIGEVIECSNTILQCEEKTKPDFKKCEDYYYHGEDGTSSLIMEIFIITIGVSGLIYCFIMHEILLRPSKIKNWYPLTFIFACIFGLVSFKEDPQKLGFEKDVELKLFYCKSYYISRCILTSSDKEHLMKILSGLV